jgi:small-conductance mechanosensitive channel
MGDMKPRYATLLGLPCGALACICACLTPSTGCAQTSPGVQAVNGTEAEVVAHLNAAVDWYHAAKASDTWVMQADDDFYKSSQDDLSVQALTSAFAYAQAMVAVVGNEGALPAKSEGSDSRSVRLATRAATNAEQLSELRGEEAALNQKIAVSQPADRPNLQALERVVEARIELESALGDTLGRVMAVVSSAGSSGPRQSLSDQIIALRRTVPGLFDSPAPNQAKTAPAPRGASDGLASRAATLIAFVRYRHALDVLIGQTVKLQEGIGQLTPRTASKLRDAVNAGEEAGKESSSTRDAAQLDRARDKIEGLASQVRLLSAALVPLQAEGAALERSRSNLTEWKASLTTQTNTILRVLFLRASTLGLALIALALISEIWRKATFKYVHDARRRRQLLLLRRFAMTIVMVFVIVMAFVSDFGSLATFAGFITAGIAVALQAIILSVAAYFFLIGRFGVKVGDRVTVSGVTGDVIDIGLVRVFLMELAGTGVDLHPTGRVVVFANSALFSGSPLYKQLPGTDYAWHEVFINVSPEADLATAKARMLEAVEKVYRGYRSSIEQQHGDLERLIDFKTDLPVPSAHVRLGETALEVVVRYPASIRNMSEVDERVAEEILHTIHGDEELKGCAMTSPRIRAAVKS